MTPCRNEVQKHSCSLIQHKSVETVSIHQQFNVFQKAECGTLHIFLSPPNIIYCVPLCTPGIFLLYLEYCWLSHKRPISNKQTHQHLTADPSPLTSLLLKTQVADWSESAVILHTNTCIHTANCLRREKSANVSLALPAIEGQAWCSRPSAVVEFGEKALSVFAASYTCSCKMWAVVWGNSRQAAGYMPLLGSLSLFLVCLFVFLMPTPFRWFWSAPSQQLKSYQELK